MGKNEVKVKKPFYKRWWFILLAVVVIFGVLTDTDDGEAEETVETEDVEVVEEEAIEEKVDEPSEEEIAKKKKEQRIRREKEQEARDNAKLEENYQEFIIEISEEYSEGMTLLSKQTGEYDPLSEEWVFNTAVAVTMIKETADKVLQFDEDKVPENLKEVHSYVISASEYYLEAMDFFVTGVDNMDVDAVNTSAELLELGNLDIEKATELILNESL